MKDRGHGHGDHSDEDFGRRGPGGRERGFGFGFGGRGPGPGFGGPGPGGRGRGLGRMLEYGDLRLILLSLINERASHGYELIKALEEKFGGIYSPSPGAIYPTLSLLDEQGLVELEESKDGGTKKRYAITEAGKSALSENQVQIDGIFMRMDMAVKAFAGERPPEVLMEAMHTLKHALLLHKGVWEEAEVKRVVAILHQAARDIANS